MSALLEVVPTGLLSHWYEVRQNDAQMGTIVNKPLRVLEKGAVTVNGREYSVVREGVLGTSYVLRAASGGTRARAE